MSAPAPSKNAAFKPVRLQQVMKEIRRPVLVRPNGVYTEIGVRSHGRGVFHKEPISGELLGNKRVFWVKPGTLVFNIVFAWERAVAVLSEAETGLIGSHRFPTYEMLPGQAHSGFMKHYFTTGYGHYLLQLNSPGAAGRNKTLNQSALMKEDVWLPSADTQKAIADYLDDKTASIDSLIEKKRRLLELLAEERVALINQAVTKGLDPAVPMKDSGIPWIGEVPAHWEVKRLKFVARFVTSDPRGWGEYYSDEGAVFLRIGNVARDSIDLRLDNIQRVQPPASAEGLRTLVNVDDLLITITADIGSVGVVPHGLGEAYVNQHVALVRPRTTAITARLLAYAAKSPWGRLHFDESMQGGTKVGLGLDDVRNMPFGSPPLDEQRRIVGYLDTRGAAFDQTECRMREQLNLLQEYRQALITAAVTGQFDIEAVA